MLNATAAGWPAPLEYCVALQDPAAAFIDPALAGGTVQSDAMGLPKPRSGQMATVFKVQTREHTWAVRCFGTALAERAERYAAISAFLTDHPNRFTVGFDYVQDGVRVDGAQYPILRMQWVDGDLLHTYLSKHRHDADALHAIARACIELSRELHALAFAHGDLQHGNVIIASGEMKLVDYDGLFVPSLAGRLAAENGHRNYQHPCRDARCFGPAIDTFSLWVVFISIVALARDASLWEALDYGDDCLAFRHDDFVRPSASPAFARLRGAADRELNALAAFLESMLSHDPQRLPPLEDHATAVEVAALRPAWLPRYAAAVNGAANARTRIEIGELTPLTRGPFREPYGVTEGKRRSSLWEQFERHRTPATIAAGGVVTAAGCEAARLAGFGLAEYGAIAALVWLLAGAIAGVSGAFRPKAPK